MKEIGFTHWNNPNTGATNECGFTALPGGYRPTYMYDGGVFKDIRKLGAFWSSTECPESIGTSFAWLFIVNHDSKSAGFHFRYKSSGISVRCVKD